ncbi:hypothetical protein [Rhodospirillum centenum]|uniref:Uncharacterized protein n=1 Tax=Rhodospirillum centenum (strain ATCC 51521 / SW) TaxID=414684 RepID=B6IVX4_RHOCS|nr:hypothetical protein [Rhodospirillum centenum]ACJ00448.1 hypothetical protein RC1_3082 [Rhodospirillum centenum SW]
MLTDMPTGLPTEQSIDQRPARAPAPAPVRRRLMPFLLLPALLLPLPAAGQAGPSTPAGRPASPLTEPPPPPADIVRPAPPGRTAGDPAGPAAPVPEADRLDTQVDDRVDLVDPEVGLESPAGVTTPGPHPGSVAPPLDPTLPDAAPDRGVVPGAPGPEAADPDATAEGEPVTGPEAGSPPGPGGTERPAGPPPPSRQPASPTGG